MNITQHPTNNHVVEAPAGVSNELCRPAPVTICQDPDLGMAVCTFWRPEKEEIDALVEGGVVVLTIFGKLPMHKIGVTK